MTMIIRREVDTEMMTHFKKTSIHTQTDNDMPPNIKYLYTFLLRMVLINLQYNLTIYPVIIICMHVHKSTDALSENSYIYKLL